MSEELVHFVAEESIRKTVEAAFERQCVQLRPLLPAADIQHVGGTAVPGCLTKGDLDIQIRVSAEQFPQAEQLLARYFARNAGSVRTSDFASFKDDAASPPLGIQLTATGGRFDVFLKLRDLLRSRADLVEQFNNVKRRHEGRPMEAYRAEKAAFIEKVLGLDPIDWTG